MFYEVLIGSLAVFTLVTVILTLVFRKKDSEGSVLEKFSSGLILFLDRFHILFTILIFLVFLFTRLYYLGLIPAGIHVDELGMAYDAFSLSRYGMDRHHVHFPVYLENYGGGQSVMYAYLTAMLLKVFPYSVKIIRLPAVLCGCMAFIASFFLVKDIAHGYFTDTKSEKAPERAVALLGPLLVTVMPYYLTSERWGLDCNLFLSFATVALFLTVRAVLSGKRPFYVLAGLVWGLALYTYAVSYLIIPLFVLFLAVYLVCLRREKKTVLDLVSFLIPLILLGIPLVLFQMVNMGLLDAFTLGLSDFRPLKFYRASEFSFHTAFKNLPCVFMAMFASDGLLYDALPVFGPVYPCMIPLLLYGAVLAIYDTVSSIRRRSVSLIAVIVLFFVASWLVFPLLTDPGLGNMNVIYVCFLVFIVYGIVSLGRIFKRSVMVCLLCMGLSFLLFVNFYFREQNEVYGLHTLFYTTKPGDVIAYARQQYDPQHQKKLYVCLDYSDIDLQNLFAGLYDQVPAEMWTPDGEDYGNIRLNLPEEFDPEEDAVYIIGEDWGGVISYLLSLGFHDDVTFDKEIILYR